MKPIEFWFDYISNNAYLAWSALQAVAARHDCEIISQPVVFAGLLNHYDSKGPAELPVKNHWMIRNVLRKARLEGLAIAPPASHPFNPLLSLRATLAITDSAQRNAFISAMFKAIWAEQQNPADEETILRAAQAVGLDGNDLIQDAQDPDIKDALQVQTRVAIRKNLFGVPSMVVDEEMFWGYDDLKYLELYLMGKDPISKAEVRPWLLVKPSAKR